MITTSIGVLFIFGAMTTAFAAVSEYPYGGVPAWGLWAIPSFAIGLAFVMR